MDNKNYLVIQDNIVTNIVVWNGDVNQWTPPSNAVMLPQEVTPAIVWGFNAELTEAVMVEHIGGGDIGFMWDGSILTTNQSKPEPPQQAIPQTTFN